LFRFPVGHPKVYLGDDPDCPKLTEAFGLVKCVMLAPKKLFNPVLPHHLNGKNMFMLCTKCASEEQQESCAHTDEERSFLGTWCTPELQFALMKGYRCLKIIEMWHFTESMIYDPATKSGGLWTAYVNFFLKEKQEASGFPHGCVTDEQKDQYIQDYYDKEGIRLEKDKIKYDPVRRTCAKIALNSIWVKHIFLQLLEKLMINLFRRANSGSVII
jgi:hypothetical protein